MTTLALSDCIRATPGRTLGALVRLAFDTVRVAIGGGSVDATSDDLDDHILADLGLPRGDLFHV